MNQPQHHSRGYTLLFAVLVSAFVLGLATSILYTSRRQVALSSSSHDSMYAVYAADTGVECARFFNPATTTSISAISCGNSRTVTSDWTLSGGAYSASFDAFFTGSTESCAKVTVQKFYDPLGNLVSRIESRGYNLYQGANCPANHPQVVERALRLTY
ncbi:MAG: hypothetical protein AAB587_02900 [Patescibacteria group bacterium]